MLVPGNTGLETIAETVLIFVTASRDFPTKMWIQTQTMTT